VIGILPSCFPFLTPTRGNFGRGSFRVMPFDYISLPTNPPLLVPPAVWLDSEILRCSNSRGGYSVCQGMWHGVCLFFSSLFLLFLYAFFPGCVFLVGRGRWSYVPFCKFLLLFGPAFVPLEKLPPQGRDFLRMGPRSLHFLLTVMVVTPATMCLLLSGG